MLLNYYKLKYYNTNIIFTCLSFLLFTKKINCFYKQIHIHNKIIISKNIISLVKNDECIIADIKEKGMLWVDKILDCELTYTKSGSISHLLYGKKPSDQSINIKLGRLGEFLSKKLIMSKNNLELLNCGVQQINDKKKDNINF